MRRATVLLVLLAAPPAFADDSAPSTAPVDKSRYTLFDPVPDDQLRPLVTDRPTVTTGPFTVDAGHVLVEAGFGTYTKDQPGTTGGDGGEHVNVLPTELRLGLTEHAELDLTVMPFELQRSPAGVAVRPSPVSGPPRPRVAAADHAGGFGDLQLQAKFNLFGNDSGDVAVGVAPYLTLPTASSTKGLGTGRVQGGVAVPVQVNLPLGFTAAAMAQFDFPRNDDNTRTGFDVLHTAIVSHAIVGSLSGYAEYVGVTPVGLGHGYQAYVDAGLTLGLGDDVQLDAGVNLGRSRDTPQYTVVAGISLRR